MTVSLAGIFLVLQAIEYSSSLFSMRGSNYGSLFFLLTGFHGMHVLIGLILLAITGMRTPTTQQHLFMELSVYYYHFVDVVWLGLMLMVY